MLNDNRPLVSIVIKALNDEQHIASAIESALAALKKVDGEVVLADAASTDRTVEIAGRYPIKIVQLNDIRINPPAPLRNSAFSTAAAAISA